jgi:predicted MPP superfamily phosphohydrolase
MFPPSLPADAVCLLGLVLFSPVAALLVAGSALSYRLARRFGRIPPDQFYWVERRGVLWTASGFLLAYAGCFLYGAFVEAHWVEVTRTEVAVAEPVLGHERFRIVHLSDLHLEGIGRRERRVVEEVRAAEPHLILLTGDYMNRRGAGPALREFLEALRAPYGILGVEGNWDGKFITEDLFKRSGAALLVDERRVIERDGRKLRVVGLGILPMKPLRDLLPAADDGVPTIVLHHKPDAVDELRARAPGQRVDLFLCGHTHGGQVCLPFWGAVLTLSKYHKRYERGRYDVEGVPMYVHRGIGMEGGGAPRVRFLSRPEVAVIDLVAGARTKGGGGGR